MSDKADLLLGIDAGTSVVKAALFDRRVREVATTRRRTLLVAPRPEWSETEMDETWAMTAAAVRDLLQQTGVEPERIAAVGLTGSMVGAWLVDDAGRPVRRGILWNDGRTQPLIDRMEAEQPGFMRRIYRSSGSVMQQGCTLPLLRWLAEHEPESLARAATVLCCKDWLGFRLTGARHLDPTEASVLPGDTRARTYSEALIDLFGLRPWRSLFPAVHPSHAVTGGLLPAAAAATGLVAGTPVVAGAGDVPASAVGLGAVRPGQACTLLGTNILNCLVTGEPLFEPADVGLLFCLPEQGWLRAMVNVSGTTALDWFIAEFWSHEAAAAPSTGALFAGLEAAAQSRPVGAGGVLFLPYLSALGITTPFLEAAARAEFFGLTDRTTRADLLRAVYEGLSLSIRDGYAVMPRAVTEIRLAGGGARSRFWSQMIADCTGRRVLVPEGSEFGARGAALLAAVGIGRHRSVTDAVEQTEGGARVFEPAPERAETYARLHALYRMLQHDLRPAWQAAAGRADSPA